MKLTNFICLTSLYIDSSKSQVVRGSIEPTTCGLHELFEPVGRIELPSTVYDTVALPLSYIGTILQLIVASSAYH